MSRGIANITFVRSESAVKAVEECNGIPVDKKPIKVGDNHSSACADTDCFPG